jgi:hypothetical protein
MAQTVPSEHPAVVLRSHYRHLRALLTVAMIALVGMTVAVVILATDDGASGARTASPVSTPSKATHGPRYLHSPGQGYDGAGEPGTRRQR